MCPDFSVTEIKVFIPTFMFNSLEDAQACTRALKLLSSPKTFLWIPKESEYQFVEFEIVYKVIIEPDELEEIMYGLKALYRHICEKFIKPQYFKRYFQ